MKAFDGATTSVAVTDTYITITPAFFVSPTSNAPNTPITLSGFAFKANALVNLTYTNPLTLAIVPIATLVQANASGIFEYVTVAPDLKQALAAGDNAIVTNVIIFSAKDNATGTNYDSVTGFSQSARGLAQVKRTGPAASEQLPSSGNWFGNLTDFTATGSLPITNVGVNSNVMIAGNRFFPGNMSIKWDNAVALATVAVNATGFFNSTVTVPITPVGTHNVTMVDANGQIFVIFLTVVPSVTLSPTSGPVGTTVTATGYGFPASTGTTKVNATIAWPGISAYVGSAITDASGSFVATFVVPQSAGGLVTLDVLQNATGSFVSTATPSFTVTASFTVSPSSFANNATLMVVASGNGFKPGCDYTVNIDNTMLGFDYKAWGYQTGIMPNATGYLSVTFIGVGFTPGVHIVTLYENGSSGAVNAGKMAPAAYASFTVLSTGDATIDAIKSMNTSLSTQLTALGAQLTGISGSIATLQTSIGGSLSTIQASVSSIGASISSVNSGIATITSNVGSISTQLSNLNAAIVAVEGDIATVSTSLGTITTSLASLDTKVTSIQGTVATVQTAIGTLQGTVTSISGDVATIKTGVGTLQTSVGTVQTDVTSTKDNTSGMSMLIYVAIAFALIAAIAAVASILLMRKKIAS
jgi:archaellum component FlaC